MVMFREFVLSSGTNIFLGKNADNNDKLVESFKGKDNKILHTVSPGSPFCVIDKINPSKEEIYEAGVICSAKSQYWRDNKSDVELHLFSGKEIKKPILAKTGTWKIISKPKVIKVKKKDIINWENEI
jgi:predicted ribosome quality control (RQC) complex YloA/Tae2 family protein